ncbi:hypothetical protein Bbelb_405880 [Branchiostoma belcheri]|nr:hypothetical protein Bbelb_405880 [Branchiostoma belcheri]
MERNARGTRSKAPAKVWFHIFVKLPRGLMTSLRVHADLTVGELQGRVEEASGIPCDVQRVTTSQNSGPDKELLLGQLGLRAGSTVSVCPDDRWRDVFGAAMVGDYRLVRRCLDGVEEGETRTNGRFCAMFLAAHRGHLDLLQNVLPREICEPFEQLLTFRAGDAKKKSSVVMNRLSRVIPDGWGRAFFQTIQVACVSYGDRGVVLTSSCSLPAQFCK